jgi:ATP-binding cassette subfamily F protein uup
MPEPIPVLAVQGLRKSYLERPILDDVSFTVSEGDRVALLGANGAGKSTLIGIITGRQSADAGEVRMKRGLRVAALPQDGDLRDDWTVAQTVEAAFAEIRELEAELDRVHHALETGEGDLEELLEAQHKAQHRLDIRDPHTIESRKDRVMAALGVPPRDRLIGSLSGGERRRTALARTLLEDADLLLLDEPTNHLDAETLDWLEEYMASMRGTIMFVTHDRYFLDNVATVMIELWRGRAKSFPGNYTDYLLAKEEEFALAERAEATRQNMLRRELEWMRRQPKARTTKSRSRMDRAQQLLDGKPLDPDPLVRLAIPGGPRLGGTVIEAEKLRYAIGGRTLIRDFSITIKAGDRIGIVGRNGLGKTTLLRLLLKQLEPQGGSVTHGSSVRAVYGDQERRALDPGKSVLEEVSDGLEYVTVGEQRIGFRAWLKAFLFTEDTAAMPVRLLSGGERNRVLLAKMLREGGNVVVMDEPTNDLDLPTLRILEEALAAFDGVALVVSHDRYFLNRIATRIISFPGDGRIVTIEGNYDSYVTWHRADEAARAATAKEERRTAPAPSAAPAKRKKLSFNEAREYSTLEARIAEAEAKLAALDQKSLDPKFYAKASREAVEKLHVEINATREEVDRLTARWLELGERA